jgi:hypothetical protein
VQVIPAGVGIAEIFRIAERVPLSRAATVAFIRRNIVQFA